MEPRASSDASLARLLPGAHCRLDVRVVDVVRLCVREDADVSWVVPPEARREALEDDVCFVEVHVFVFVRMVQVYCTHVFVHIRRPY